MPAPSAAAAATPGIYSDFEAFLKQGLREYYDRSWTTRKGNFIALLIASGQTAMSLAKDSVVDGSGTKKMALGAGLLIALRVGLRWAIGGPLGMVLTVAAGASMVSYFIKNQKDIVKKVGIYKAQISAAHGRFDDIQAGWRDGKHSDAERTLMVDGLLKRFVAECDDAA